MPQYQITSPSGQKFVITAPEGVSQDDVLNYAQQQFANQHRYGSGAAGMQDAVGGQAVPSGSAAAQAAQSPVSDMSGGQRFLAGAGKGFVDLGRGAGQMVGAVSRKDVADSRARDASLMATGAGKWGDIAGTTAGLIPAAFIPGANTVAGAAGIGAGLGLLAPSASTGETATNTALGGLLSPAGLLAGRGLGALWRGGKAALDPLFKGGQGRIAARTLQAMAGGPEAAEAAAAQLTGAGRNVLPGVQPTTAELANNAGLAQFSRTIANQPENLTATTARQQANRAAMTGALDKIAGTDADMTAATRARSAVADPLYSAARDAQIVPDASLKGLLSRPSLSGAWDRAQKLAAERGEALVEGRDIPAKTTTSSMVTDFGSPSTTTTAAQSQTYSGRAIQYLKMGLNDLISGGPTQGIGSHELNALKATRGSLNDWIQANVPALKTADTAYAAASRPINAMEVGQALRNKLVPALGDYGNNTRLSAASYANALRNGDTLAANATGNPSSTLADVLPAEHMQTVRQVAEQLARTANAAELGRSAGSNTAQNLASQNVLRQFAGPLGLPQSAIERAAQSTLGQTITSPVQFVGKLGETKVMDLLTQAALDPNKAAALLRSPQGSRAGAALWRRQGLLGAPQGAQTALPVGQMIQGLLGNAPQ